MKKSLLTLALVLSGCLNAFSQATSLTVDCQNPGWLSSMINYGDQQTLKDIKITGYLNGTDIKFIRELNLNRSLSGVIDLEGANIVSGGESYGTFTDSYIGTRTPTTKDNTLSEFMFAYLDKKRIRKIILPESITECEQYLFVKTVVDTIVINGNLTHISVGDGYNNLGWGAKCIYLPEGITNINFNYLFAGGRELFLPSTLMEVTGKYACVSDKAIFHCSSLKPEDIKVTGYQNNNYSFFNNGTIYVPKGTKEKYENSIFSKLTIIEDIHVEGVSIDENRSLYVGDEVLLQAQITPLDALNKKIKWVSDNPSVVEVFEDGTIKAITYGNANITAKTEDGGFEATCSISVFEHTTGIGMIDEISIPIDKTYMLNAHTLPLSISDEQITYKSSNDEIATVNSQGTITGKKKGTCTITATSVDGGHTATCEVTVTQPVETLTLEKHSTSLKVGETETLYAQITPATANNKNIKWSSLDEKIISVDESGIVTALKAGKANIKAESVDNPEAYDVCEVTVTQPATGISLNMQKCTLTSIGESAELVATVTPEDASNKNVKWKSKDESVCIVANGTVVAVGSGVCVIIATSEDGGYMATCTVTVSIYDGVKGVNGAETITIESISDAAGRRINSLQRGMNILRMSDGTTKKVLVK